jgi:hypothetical protein
MYRGDSLVFSGQVVRPAPGTTAHSEDPKPILRPFPDAYPPRGPVVPVDITLYAIHLTAKYELPDYDQQAVFALSNAAGGGIVYTTPTAGLVAFTGPALATRSFPDGPVRLIYDVQVTDSLGVVSTVDFGYLLVRPNARRTTP